MKARHVVGRRIVAVRQSWFNDGEHGGAWEIDALVLDNGGVIYFSVNEHISEYGVAAHYAPPEPKPKPGGTA
jgi:hypothetical protein